MKTSDTCINFIRIKNRNDRIGLCNCHDIPIEKTHDKCSHYKSKKFNKIKQRIKQRINHLITLLRTHGQYNRTK